MGVMGKAAGAIGGAGKGLLKSGGGGMTSAAASKARGPVRAPRGGVMRTVASKLQSTRGMTGGRR